MTGTATYQRLERGNAGTRERFPIPEPEALPPHLFSGLPAFRLSRLPAEGRVEGTP